MTVERDPRMFFSRGTSSPWHHTTFRRAPFRVAHPRVVSSWRRASSYNQAEGRRTADEQCNLLPRCRGKRKRAWPSVATELSTHMLKVQPKCGDPCMNLNRLPLALKRNTSFVHKGLTSVHDDPLTRDLERSASNDAPKQ